MVNQVDNDTVLYKKKGAIGIITLNRPKKYNAINLDLQWRLLTILQEIEKDAAVRVVILTGNGKGFCAGADMSSLNERPAPNQVRDNLLMMYRSIVRNIALLDRPVIAAINGPVAGAGLGFALACDFRVMADHANMRYAFINIGLVPDAGSTWFLARQVGYSKALEIIIGGEKIPAKECHTLGLANKLCAAEELMPTSIAWAERLATMPTLAIGASKRVLNYAMENDLMSTIAKEADEQMACLESYDHMEGVMAFLQKRKPEFKGK